MSKVEIYSTPTCIYCAHAKKFFQDNNVNYEEFNVASDIAKRQEMVEKSGQLGVPVITIDDNVVVGFDEGKLRELLSL